MQTHQPLHDVFRESALAGFATAALCVGAANVTESMTAPIIPDEIENVREEGLKQDTTPNDILQLVKTLIVAEQNGAHHHATPHKQRNKIHPTT
jgi:hypothetical protein